MPCISEALFDCEAIPVPPAVSHAASLLIMLLQQHCHVITFHAFKDCSSCSAALLCYTVHVHVRMRMQPRTRRPHGLFVCQRNIIMPAG
jgi:hypothetical protein